MSGLSLEQVSRRSGDRVLLEGLDLAVAPGECLALLGPSGCGKTTTLRLVAGLDPCSSGRILLNGEDITHRPAGERQVAMVFQSYALFPHLDVGENLALGLRSRGVPRPERDRRIAAVLELLELTPLVRRRPAQLSGGQRQRVALARALLRQPRIVLLDEPMSNLDARLREDLRPELRRLLCGGEPPVLYVTHDQQEAMGMADRIAVLQAGRLEQVGGVRELYTDPRTRFVADFLGRPAINWLPAEGGRVLGVRPEHLRPQAEGGIAARPLRREWWGHQPLVWLETPHGTLRMLLPAGGELLDYLMVGWRAENELWFDADGRRIDGAGPWRQQGRARAV
ncbi:ABC transporter ATP-binding protein [Cyanobium sp. FGCU-52]|nr:ABC transporter ATP-binding protein [Cyanobium sp. FGCU52]